jgi:hypothetical protein
LPSARSLDPNIDIAIVAGAGMTAILGLKDDFAGDDRSIISIKSDCPVALLNRCQLGCTGLDIIQPIAFA